jgi:two-component system chemotaxis sensor kinase CheA
MPLNDDQILAEFVVESREHLAGIETQLLAIEAGGEGTDLELVNTVFRAVHSIKGAAGFLGLQSIGHLAHALENVLNLIRNQQLTPDSIATDVMLHAADKLRGMIEDVDHSNAIDVSAQLRDLERVAAGDRPSSEPSPPRDECPPEPAPFEPAVEPPSTSEPSPNAFPTAEAAASLPAEAERGSAEPAKSASPPATATPAAATPAAADSSIRVNVGVLDRLMNLAGELVLARNQLLQVVNSSEHRALTAVGARLNQVTSELQETIMQTRLQTIGTVFNRFPRIVRDLSITLGKECLLTLEGQEVEVDKSILQAISDPLTHLVRNAVDHGVERPEVRARAGKPPVGKIAMRAFHQAGKVNIVVTDDGRGIDVARIKEKAVARGLLSPDQARTITDREALQLVFRPGFSTAERVTEVSGRGVGMDVVKTNIERLGGTVSIETQLGRGTTFHVKLPLTLAIIPSLIVRAGGRRYAIPQTSIRELVRVKASEAAQRIEHIKKAQLFRLRGTLLPLVQLSAALDLHADPSMTAAGRPINIIVVEAGHLRYGLVVDGLCDSEEIVVKPLGRHMKGCSCLAAATILGDGSVALILDCAGIAVHSQLTSPEEDTSAQVGSRVLAEETQSLLLFSNDPGEYFGIPMELVARIERVVAHQIDSVGGQQVLQYRGGTLPLLTLEQQVRCRPRPDKTKLYVVVFASARREVGVLVPELLDIRNVPTQIDTETFREPGIIGSVVYDGMTVRLVDLHELTRKAHPEWFESQPPVATTPEGTAPRILLAEDSDFFRKQLVGFLESEGYDVEGCEDGLVAWNTLQDPGSHFDLVVTDIEMPNMTGLELTRAIRQETKFAKLPIIAVSSLAGEDDIRQGRLMGVSEYHVKLDREQLLASVSRLTRGPGAKAKHRSLA